MAQRVFVHVDLEPVDWLRRGEGRWGGQGHSPALKVLGVTHSGVISRILLLKVPSFLK